MAIKIKVFKIFQKFFLRFNVWSPVYWADIKILSKF